MFHYLLIATVRLTGGSHPGEGRVELYYNSTWGTVCDYQLDINEAHVVCRELGYSGASAVYDNAAFGHGTGPIWWLQNRCTGNENNLLSCSVKVGKGSSCTHEDDAGVVCQRKKILNSVF